MTFLFKMGAARRNYTLDDGQTVTFQDVMDRVEGIKKGAAVKRLRGSSDPAVIFSPKGTMNGLYQKPDKHKLKRTLVEIEADKEVRERKEIVDYIKETKPFYSDPFYKLALMSIST